MKLIAKYNRVNIIATIAVMLSASICYFFMLRYVLIRQLDNTLKVEEAEILNYVKRNNRLPEATHYRDQQIRFDPAEGPVKRKFNNIELVDGHEHETNPYRELVFPISVGNQFYKASVTKTEEEMEDLVMLIVLITMGLIILLLLILFITNRLLLRKIWKPFYDTLDSIKAFNLSNKKYEGSPTDTEEFRELDNVVQTMTSQIIKDYDTLKNFADNASHEMQTPLAILNSKLDLLIQEPGLTETHSRQLQSMYDAITRLTKLNQSLLLLTKIGNNQFKEVEMLSLDSLIKQKILQMEDLISTKQLQLTDQLQPVSLKMNEYLTDTLLNNLLGNAIRHNVENGSIHISLDNQKLLIRNTGPALSFDPSVIFDRFKKSSRSEGSGLGLAIVKQICDNYQYTISYFFKDNLHHFEILF
ncbi:MAG: HAMP domain-containing histidine kinase [Bacteroidetes bacterium]|nr:HAMP domain-containing histidine kinase [Bacteroidota bacterium]